MMSRRNKLLAPSVALLAVVAAAAVAAGCGSDATLTKVEFIKQGDEICAKSDKRQKAGLRTYEGQQSANRVKAQEAAVEIIGLPPMQLEAEELAELGAPKGEEAKAEAIVKAIEDAVKEGEVHPLPVLKAPGQNTFAKAEKMARDYGFKICGEV